MRFGLRSAFHDAISRAALGTVLAICACIVGVAQQAGPPPPAQGEPPPNAPLPQDQLQELVAPIALYPDALVAQILAAATYPTQIVEAERFIEQNPGLSGQALANAVNGQDWDPSVKALAAFPSVLSDMNNNLSWTSELGDVNVNQPDAVMNAVQFMRRQAQQAGNLQSTPQQSVDDVNNDVEIQPADPDTVYVPDYNPEYVYGYPVGLWPGFDPWWTAGGPYFSFGVGIGIRPFWGFGWGWHNWGLGWGTHPGVWFGGARWISHSPSFYDRQAFMHGDYRGMGAGVRGGFGGDTHAMRGFSAQPNPGTRSGAFGGFGHGGDVRGSTARGFSSMGGGGGGFHGGGGGHGGR